MAPVMGKMWGGRIGMFSGNCQQKNKGDQIEFYLSSHLHTHSHADAAAYSCCTRHETFTSVVMEWLGGGDGAETGSNVTLDSQQNKDRPPHVIFWVKGRRRRNLAGHKWIHMTADWVENKSLLETKRDMPTYFQFMLKQKITLAR